MAVRGEILKSLGLATVRRHVADGAYTPAIGDEAETRALIDEEARRGARTIVPFLFVSLWFMRMVLADVAKDPAVRAAFVVQIGFVLLRSAR